MGEGLEMLARISYNQAAAILGCHVSNVAKLVAKGELTSTGKRGASLDLAQVEALGERRAAEREERAARLPSRISGSIIAPTKCTNGCHPARSRSCSALQATAFDAGSTAASCPRSRTVGGSGFDVICSSRWRRRGW